MPSACSPRSLGHVGNDMNSEDLGQLKRDAVDTMIFHATPKAWLTAGGGPWLLERGDGARLYDADGREYLDALSGGVFAVLVGYGRDEIAQMMAEQARRLCFAGPYATVAEVTVELARRLADLAPGTAKRTGCGEDRTFVGPAGLANIDRAFRRRSG